MSADKGIFILLAGANGSGKSTVMQEKIDKIVKHYANPDKDPFNPRRPDLCQKVIENEHKWRIENPKSFEARCAKENLAAWLIDPQIRTEGIGTESNLVSSKTDSKRFRLAKSYGMRTKMYFVGLRDPSPPDASTKGLA